MKKPEPKCPDCKTPMVIGDLLYSPNGLLQCSVEWLERGPGGKFRRKVVSYRCPDCGLMRDYAIE